MNELIFIIEESLDGGYEAEVVGASIFTEAETIEELKESMKDAVRCHFDEKDMHDMVRFFIGTIPKPSRAG